MNKLEFKQSEKKLGYSVPTLITGYGAFYYLCDRDPTSSEPDCYTDLADFVYMWKNQTSGQIWWCLDNTSNAMIWAEDVNQFNISSVFGSMGWGINSERSYSSVSSPAFGTDYYPSESNDTSIVVTFSHASTLLGSALVQVQVNDSTIAESGISGVVATNTSSLSFIVPAGSSYKFVNSSGTNSIILVKELSM